tara:strand:+ start:7710 stop:9125 length:1416 start_codon:yes stop_codon:yes gene_type:complete
MKFSELESLMFKRGAKSLADIARKLNTTPQAVSNWKSRDQVPHHVISQINIVNFANAEKSTNPFLYDIRNEKSISDLFLILAEQIKLIVIVPFVVLFLSFTYVQLIVEPKFESWATILIPENNAGDIGGLASIASEFGVGLDTRSESDLSSLSLIPELLKSRRFIEKILDQKFYTEKYNKELSLLEIISLNDKKKITDLNKAELTNDAVLTLKGIVKYDEKPNSAISAISVTTFESKFSKNLAEIILKELELLNRYFKSQSVLEKVKFIEDRIFSVENDLENSELKLKEFSEQNRQISSPSLRLEFERLTREVEIQKGVYLTLKQQLEIAKIEEIQEASILRVLDAPEEAVRPSNKKIRQTIFVSILIGLALGTILALLRGFIVNSDSNEKRKIEKMQIYFKEKIFDIYNDKRVYLIIITLFVCASPFYFGYQSKAPVFFGLYSSKLMFIIVVYSLITIISIVRFFQLNKK